MYMKIRAVLLDFGGTLAGGGLDWDPYHETIRNYLLSLGYDVEMSDLKKALRGALSDLEKVRSCGKEMCFEEVYSIFLNNLGIMPDDPILEWLHENFKVHYKTSFYPCIEDVLKKLSSKYKVAMVSNTMSDQPKLLLRDADLDKYFDLLVCSRDLAVRKPNPEIFRIVLRELGVPSSEAVHVGDSVEADMLGAQESGLTGIWIKSPNQEPWSGYAISSICELLGFLEEISD